MDLNWVNVLLRPGNPTTGLMGLRTLQGGVKHETSKPNQEIAEISDVEDSVMAIFATRLEPFPRQPDEHEIREGVHDLRRVEGSIIILRLSVKRATC